MAPLPGVQDWLRSFLRPPQGSLVPPPLSKGRDPSPLTAFRRMENEQEQRREESACQQDATIISRADPEPVSITASIHPITPPDPRGHHGLTATRFGNPPLILLAATSPGIAVGASWKMLIPC